MGWVLTALFASGRLCKESLLILSGFAPVRVHKSDEEWRVQLSPEQFRILRKKGTEMAGTGEYDKHVCSVPYHLITPLFHHSSS